MSAWAGDTLSNDPASDFLAELTNAADRPQLLTKTLRAVLPSRPGPWYEEEGFRAIAAAEVIAAANGFPTPTLPDEHRDFGAQIHASELPGLTDLARKVVVDLCTASSVRELMVHGADDVSWTNAMNDLARRLERAMNRP